MTQVEQIYTSITGHDPYIRGESKSHLLGEPTGRSKTLTVRFYAPRVFLRLVL